MQLKVVKVNGVDSTDQALMVSTASKEEVSAWDSAKIVDSLKLETKLADSTIAEIAEAVGEQVTKSGLEQVTTTQVRELIDGELVRRGFTAAAKAHGLMSIPAKNLESILTGANMENSNTTYNPESVNLTIAELMLKQYALAYVYSHDVAEAHLRGDIHLHDLGLCVRPYCGGHSLEYVKKYGLTLPNITSVSKPAKHPEVLVGHMVKMASTLQMNYAGAVGWEAVNTFFAPFIRGMEYVKIKQIAQQLIFEFNQLAGARGGQSETHNQRIAIYDSEEKSIKNIAIGEFCDSYYGKGEDGTKRIANRYEAISFNKDGVQELKPIYGTYRHLPKNDVYRIILSSGKEIDVTEDHSLFTLNEEGLIVECKPSDNPATILTGINGAIEKFDSFDVGHYVKGIGGRNYCPERLPLNYGLCRLIGFCVGDGYFQGSTIAIATANDELDEQIKQILQDNSLPYSVRKEKVTLHINSGRKFTTFMREICGHGALSKRVPTEIMFGPKEAILGFIDGVISSDGYVGESHLEINTISEDLKDGLIYLLGRLGIPARATLRERIVESIKGIKVEECNPIWRVCVPKKHWEKLLCLHPAKGLGGTERKVVEFRDYDYSAIKPLLKEYYGVNKSFKEKIAISLDNLQSYLVELRSNIDAVDDLVLEEQCEKLNVGKVIAAGSGINDTNVWFDYRMNSSNASHILDRAKQRIRNCISVLERANGVLPEKVISIEKIDYEGFVYDIAVKDNENFMCANGIYAHNTVFSDFNIYYGVPARFQETPALVPGGKYRAVKDGGLLGVMEAEEASQELPEGYRWLTYKDFEWESNLFAKALFDVYRDGDACGKTFVFPKPLLHINQEGMDSPGWAEFFELACRVASEKGTTYFVFDRDEACVSQCCRLKLAMTKRDIERSKTPEALRFSALQNTTINLPRLAYKAEHDVKRLYELFQEHVDLVAKSHLQKRKFIRKLMTQGVEGPLSFFAIARDGGTYLRLDELTYLVGIFGLNECVQYHTGHQLHEKGTHAFEFGLEIISRLHDMVEEASERYKLKMVIEETPAESSGYRLATLDLNEYPEQTRSVIKGDRDNGNYYYTNSIHLAADAPVDFIERIERQSEFHPYIKGGAIIHVWLGEHEPPPASIANVVMKTYEKTDCHQIAFSPEFTVCDACRRTTRGLSDSCPECGSEDVYGITRVVGYFSKVQSWNRGKLSELRDRNREAV